MNIQTVLDPEAWAEQTFGQVQLRDMRRTRRAVQAACAIARDASASLPKQQQNWKGVRILVSLAS
ncbi:transposase [Ktedonospora formicarum]|uniref:Transposase Tn5-like N-terminal domain-containing protein n=1 Tax=Ktedonospora formicarum TaxID=2778364 RepID=A0A8J3MWG5_9CHLR|nr:transposase [Ktedonospora formicarum]GHO48628.1 hypothetical protein KSX_67910 [Ktedonospora formicarum]